LPSSTSARAQVLPPLPRGPRRETKPARSSGTASRAPATSTGTATTT
jgi:hypothetical protein